jgi:putative ABC transport system ATP-binding protein
MEEILSFKNLDYFYEGRGKRVDILKDASYGFEKGKLYTLLGPSGSGKTTTLALAAALDAPRSGEVLFGDQSLKKIGFTKYRSSKIGIVFQSYNLLPYMNALQNVMMVMEISRNKVKNPKERGYQLLEKVGIGREMAGRNINKLSGGEQQRVAIARAISTDAELILADEPTGNLDVKTAGEIIKIFLSLAHDEGKCVIAVTHSVEFSEQADVVIRLEDGKLVS